MARLKVDTAAMDAIENKLQDIQTDMKGIAVQQILRAGANVVVEAWQTKITETNHVVTGAMRESVDMTNVRIDTSGSSVEVYPQGTDRHRITNAQKAFIIHYGRGGRKTAKTGDRFVTKAEKASKEAVTAAMQAELNKIIGEE